MALTYLDVMTNTWYMGRRATQKIPMEFMNFYNVVYIEKIFTMAYSFKPTIEN